MGFKSILGKIGKIALTAAPYVAAPFTGGASLMATGLANKAVSKWSESDAKKQIAKGLAPSSFDRVLGKVGAVSGLASSFIPTNALGAVGMLGKAGSTASKVASTASKASKIGNVLKTVAKIAPIAGAGIAALKSRGGSDSGQGIGPSQAVARNMGDVMPRGGYRYSDNPMNQLDQSNPNLAQSIFQGRQEAIQNQPFRKGYDVTTLVGEPDEAGKYETKVSRMPRITSGRPDVRRPKRANGSSAQELPEETPAPNFRRGGGKRERVPAY